MFALSYFRAGEAAGDWGEQQQQSLSPGRVWRAKL